MKRFPRAVACAWAVITLLLLTVACSKTSVTPEEARTIAKEAYVYGYPMVDGYRILYS